MWARIDKNGFVAELLDVDPSGRFNAELLFVACAAGTGVGDIYDGVSITPFSATSPQYIAYLQATIQAAQAAAWAAIDARAGQTRLKYITDVAGQSETYLSKATDAAAYKAAGYPAASIATYPMVQAEALALYGATPTPAQFQAAADGILTQQAQWIQLAAAIEQQRRSGKLAVQAAASVSAVQAAQQAAIAALSSL